MVDQIPVALGKVATAEKASVGRIGRGVRSFQNQVPAAVDAAPLALGRATPQQEDRARAVAVDHLDHFVGETFPTAVGVRLGLGALHREHAVQE